MTPSYDNRYVAFIDILGFSALVESIEKKPAVLAKLLNALELVQQVKPKWGKSITSSPDSLREANDVVSATAFSDSVVISTNLNLNSLVLLFSDVSQLCFNLLRLGVMTRGGITIGKLHHGPSALLGRGLIDAYRMETTLASYPRVVVHESVHSKLVAVARQREFRALYQPFTFQDFDGLFSLHFLQPQIARWLLLSETKNTADAYAPLQRVKPIFNDVRKAIELSLKASADPRIRSKAHWLARYFNRAIARNRTLGLQKLVLADDRP